MANLYGSAPIAQASGAGSGGHRRHQGGGGGGGNNTPSGPLYGGNDQGNALTNQDPAQYIQDLLGQLHILDSSGSAYGTWRNTTLADTLLSGYRQAYDNDKNLNPADYFRNTYGTGWTDASGKKHHQTPSVFNAGTLGSVTGPTSDQYQDYLSNTDPTSYLAAKYDKLGLTLPTGGNADFTNYLNKVFSPQLEANLAAAQSRGATSPDSTLVTLPGAAGGTPSTLPFGSSGDFGGDPLRHHRGRHHHGTGTADPAAPAPSTAAPTGGGMPISLNDFLANQNLVQQARQQYAFRPDSQRTPGPLNMAGRWSWWG